MPGLAVSPSLALMQSIETSLREHLPRSSFQTVGRLGEAVEYALFPGGKRIRPLLTLLTAQLITDGFNTALPVAAALEFLHTSSLIFDDLPCMDDAGVRRSRPAVHVLFGEANAILAGLVLLNQAYGLLKSNPMLLDLAIGAIGPDGMIGGQAADLAGGSAEIRNRKTSGLMRLTMVAGPAACGATPIQLEVLSRCGYALGEAYQMLDDLRDRLPYADKTPGQDERHGRISNYRELGLNGCRQRLGKLLDQVESDLAGEFRRTEASETLIFLLRKLFLDNLS